MKGETNQAEPSSLPPVEPATRRRGLCFSPLAAARAAVAGGAAVIQSTHASLSGPALAALIDWHSRSPATCVELEMRPARTMGWRRVASIPWERIESRRL